MTRPELRVFLQSVPFCGCGNPAEAADALLRVLHLFPLYYAEPQRELDKLVPDRGLQMLFLYMFDAMELTEHGSSVYGGWLTEKGQAVLAALEGEAEDSFKALFADHCACGFDIDDLSHTCA